MKLKLKRVVAVITGVAVIASSAMVSYAAQLPTAPESDSGNVYAVPTPPESNPIIFALRRWSTSGTPGYYVYELHVQTISDDVVKLECRFGTTGEFSEIGNREIFVGTTNTNLYIEVQAHMKNGYIFKDTFSYGDLPTPSSSTPSTTI